MVAAGEPCVLFLSVSCEKREDLYHGVNDLDWSEHLDAKGTLFVSFTGRVQELITLTLVL